MPKQKARPPAEPKYQRGDLLVRLDVPIEAQTALRYLPIHDKPFYEFGTGKPKARKSPPPPQDVYLRPREGTSARQQLDRLANLVTGTLSAADPVSLKLNDIYKKLATKGISPADAERAVRTLVAVRIIRITKPARGDYEVSLSDSSRAAERRRSYSAAFAGELKAYSEQIGRLIGHGPTVGSEREELLRALLQRHVPQRFHVATGFIDGLPNQFDIIIYDQIDHAPFLRVGNLVVVPPSSVRAIIEVKSNLTAQTLASALDHLSPAGIGIYGGPPIFRGVFAYRGMKPAAIARAIKRSHRPATSSNDMGGDPITTIHDMVAAVCVLEKSMIRTAWYREPGIDGFNWMPATVSVASDTERALQAGAFFDLLDLYLREPFKGPFDRSSLMDAVRDDMLWLDVTPIYDDGSWTDGLLLDDDGEYLDDQIASFTRWLVGGSWKASVPAPI